MAQTGKEQFYKRALNFLQNIDGANDEEKIDIASRFADLWMRDANETGASETDFIRWMVLNEKFVPDDQAAQNFLTRVGAVKSKLPDTHAFVALADAFDLYFDDLETAAQREKALLSVVMLEKYIRDPGSMGEISVSNTAQDDVNFLCNKYGFTRYEIAALDLRREETLFHLYENVDIWNMHVDEERKADLHLKLAAEAEIYGLIQGSDFSKEFKHNYAVYRNDKAGYWNAIEAKRADVEKMATDAATQHNEEDDDTASQNRANTPRTAKGAMRSSSRGGPATPTPNATDKPQTQPAGRTPQKPYLKNAEKGLLGSHVNVFPLRDYDGNSAGYIGELDGRRAVERMFYNNEKISLTQDFPLNGLSLQDKKEIKIRQLDLIKDWYLSAEKILWTTETTQEDTTLSNTTIKATEGDITVGQTDKVTIKLEGKGSITAIDVMKNSIVELGSQGSFTIQDRFENSVFKTSPSSDARVLIKGDRAKAINASFVGILPFAGNLNEELWCEYTPNTVNEILASIEQLLSSTLSLGRPGYTPNIKNHWSRAFYPPRIMGLKENDFATINFLMMAASMGYKGQNFAFVTPELLTEHFPAEVGKPGGGFLSLLSRQQNFSDKFFCHDKLSQWQRFVDHVTEKAKAREEAKDEARAKGKKEEPPEDFIVHMLVNPLFPSPEDFDILTGQETSIDSFYRLTFYTGSLEQKELYALQNTTLTKNKNSTLGYQRNYLQTLEKKLTKDNGQTFSIDICVTANRKISAEATITDSMVSSTKPLYQALRGMFLDHLFQNTWRFSFDRWVITTRGNLSRLDANMIKLVHNCSNPNDLHLHEKEKYDNGKKTLQNLIPPLDKKITPTIIDGAFFQHCSFSGKFKNVSLHDIGANSFTSFKGNNVTLIGNMKSSDFMSSTIKGFVRSKVALSSSYIQESTLKLSGTETAHIDANHIVAQSSSLKFSHLGEMLAKRSHIVDGELKLTNVGTANLSNATLENCTIKIKNINELKAVNTNFVRCTITFDEPSTSCIPVLDFEEASFSNTIVSFNGGMVNLCNATIRDASKFSGPVNVLNASNAQLGSDIDSPETMEWEVKPETMKASGLRIGNVYVYSKDAFGDPAKTNEIKAPVIVGGPVFIGDSMVLFDSLKFGNAQGEQKPFKPDSGAKDAPSYTL